MSKLLRRLILAAAVSVVIAPIHWSQAQTFVVNPPRVATVTETSETPAQPAPSGTFPAGNGPGGSVSCAVSGSSQPAPLVALVLALKCDPDLIFEYVYNNIEFEPIYGSHKGALGTLLDRRGGDADQTILFNTLLNIAGYSQTSYANVSLPLSGTLISNWLNVPNDANEIQNLLVAGGIPFTGVMTNPDGTLAQIQVNHFAAGLQLNGTQFIFDPSFKQHTITSGVANLASALGYSKSQLLSDAGGTIDSVSISNVNRRNLRADLVTYSTNLINFINQNDRTWSVANVIGGKTIQPLTGSPIRLQQSTTFSPTFPATCPNQMPVIECRSFITITMPGASSSQAIKLYTDQIYGHRITVFSQPSGSNFIPTLLVDGAAPACVAAGTCTNVGPATTAGATWSVPIQVFLPNQFPISACVSGITVCTTLSVGAGGSYLISLGIGRVGRGMVDYHRQLLAQARATGNADSSELVLGENLTVISYNYLAQAASAQAIIDHLSQVTQVYHVGIGIVGQANIQQSGFQGPYVDLPLNVIDIVAQRSNGSTITIGGNTYLTSFVGAAFADICVGSTLESAVLEQTQAPVAGMTAASTIKIIDSNMNPAYPGALQRTFFADGTTAAGQSTYTSTILPLINTRYNTTDLAKISNAVANGNQVLIPQNGELAIGLWTGGGFSTILPQAGALGLFQLITGGMSGGFSGADIPNPAPNTQVTLPPVANSDTSFSIINSIPAPANPKAGEPIDAISGAYVYSNGDLLTGSGTFPYAITFSRAYLSSTGTWLTTTTSDTGIGNGWSHNWSSNVQIQSDPYLGVGTDISPAVSAATSIAALYVIQDLVSATPTAQTLTILSMVGRWFSDQLTSNAAIVTQPDTIEEFIALPHQDGSTSFAFNPPPGSSTRLSQISTGQFSHARKDGVVANFGPSPAGALQNIVYPNGVTINLTYSGSPLKLSGVSNNLQRSLSLAYIGPHVASVTDDSGRRVTYGYDGNNNLTAVTDTLGAVTRFNYDTTGALDTSGHLTQVFYPAVPDTAFVKTSYDSLGRVVAQGNASGNVSNFYFAGSRTEIIDLLGNRHVTYQTDRGRVLSDAYVLSGNFGDVFSDTVQQNGLINITRNLYDGLDRLIQTSLPEGGSVTYTYASDVNPWANNLASSVQSPKPGSPLPPLTTIFNYDATFNKPVSIVDPRGLVTTMGYDGFGNLTSSVLDFGSPPHLNARTTSTYNSIGQILTTTDPVGTVTLNSYDDTGNLLSTTRDAGTGRINQLSSFSYNAQGDVTSVTDPAGNVTISTYDAARRLLSSRAPNGLTTSNTYDPNGQLIATRQALNGITLRSTGTTYTATGKPATTTDANGNKTTTRYDALDRVASVSDPVGRVTSYDYDALSRQISISNPAIQGTPLLQKAYTPDGLLASLTDANNHATSLAYDGLDRLSTTTYPLGSTEALTYDADNNVLTRKTRAGATISFNYDTLNRLTTKTPPSPAPAVTYSYDLAGRPIGVSDTSAAIVAAVPPGGTSVQFAANYSYDVMNRPTGVTWSPASAAAAPTASSVSFIHRYNNANQRISQTISDNSWVNYPAATPSTVSYTADALNRYTAVGAVSPTYDGNSNLTSDGSFTLGYDAENRLTSASGAGNTASYAYDAQGRRKSRTVNGAATVFVTDADNREVLEYDGTSGAIQRWYSYARGPNDLLNQMNVAAATRATLLPDILGSIIASRDSSSGALTKVGYLPYGTSPSTGPFGFTGQRVDTELNGLYYYRARHYSPAWGRFLQVDPIGYSGGTNLYAYVGNDPLNSLDPMGTLGLLFSIGGETTAGASPYYAPAQGSIPTGAFATGTVALGIFSSGSFGVSGTVGAGAYQDPSKNNAMPDQTIQPYISGFSFSKGVAISATTAQTNSDLSGISSVSDVNLGILQLQTVKGTNAAGEPVTTWTLSPCLCLGYAKYQTYTAASSSEYIVPPAYGETSGLKPK